MTSSAKERIQITFCPVADPHHAAIEVNCEPGHPFMVDKKGKSGNLWCNRHFLNERNLSCQVPKCVGIAPSNITIV